MRIWLAILVTLGACKDHDVERLTAVKRDVCACKDTQCADQAMSGIEKTALRSTPRTQAIARDIIECRAKLDAAERPNTDPDTEGSAGNSDDPSTAGSGNGSAAGSGDGSAAPAPAKPR
ncbi:MAG TPA: hypothetical protein VHW23_28350 [Kofleriaceae bacterium]|nr:hypothetical protein [Kofleriaceae bacterium]